MTRKDSLFLLLLAFLIACTPAASAPPTPTTDLAQLYLNAMQTVVAEVTLTAAAFSPTPEPTATFTPAPSPTAGTPAITLEFSPTPVPCNSLTFDPATVDVNYPDGTIVSPGQEFTKTWRVKNNGSCTWGTGYGLVYAGYADRMNGIPQPLPKAVLPNEEVLVSVLFRAPTKAGEYLSAWRMSAPIGGPFGKPLFVKIVVP
uniref:Nbr1 FW domain-containing protein n=1 Tax=uncultured Chloroflexota bacterium TaxID=166587 RepID=H5SER0_9CHLR|nr:hypothetical protein HGMM_F17E05C06 [uncultured Chloroflexota bacterium]